MSIASGQISSILEKHFKKNFLIYFLVFISLIIGVVFGTVVVGRLEPAQSEDVLGYLEEFFKGYDLKKLDTKEVVARERVMGNLQVLGITWLLGFSIIGTPLIIMILFVRGFIIGFTVGFLIKELVAKGIFIAILSVLPHNLLFLPALGLLAIGAFSFAYTFVKSKKSRYRRVIYHNILGYTGLGVVMLILGVGAGLIEAYITPVFMSIIAKYLI